jgi:hypothetical protein
MALWGNNDNLNSSGTVAFNYGNNTVTGTSTRFGIGATSGVGHTEAQVGDVIRFGDRTGTYFGDAVIKGITSTTVLSIASTAGLDGNAISGVQYQISTLPKSSILDSSYGDRLDKDEELKRVFNTTVGLTTNVSIGSSMLPIDIIQTDVNGNVFDQVVQVGDFVTINSVNIPIKSIGSATVVTTQASAVGFKTVFVNSTRDVAGPLVQFTAVNVAGNAGNNAIAAIGRTSITLANPLTNLVGVNALVTFTDLFTVGLGATVSAGLATDAILNVDRFQGGYDKYVYGVSGSGLATATSYAVPHAGWVGVHTYRDTHGNLRVKSEVLVAMSGIQTGNTPVYPPA